MLRAVTLKFVNVSLCHINFDDSVMQGTSGELEVAKEKRIQKSLQELQRKSSPTGHVPPEIILSKDNESGMPLISEAAVLVLDVMGDNSFIFPVDAEDVEKLSTYDGRRYRRSKTIVRAGILTGTEPWIDGCFFVNDVI